MPELNKRGHKKWSLAEKTELLSKYYSWSSSLSSFCVNHNVSVSTLHGWLRNERKGGLVKDASKFIKVSPRVVNTKPIKSPEENDIGTALRSSELSLMLRFGNWCQLEYRRGVR